MFIFTNFHRQLNGFLQDTSIQQSILQLKENVTQISALHTQSINAVGEVSRTETDEIDSLTASTRTLIQDLKQRIKRLESAPQQQDAQLRKNRVTFFLLKFINPLTNLFIFKISLLRSKFLEAIQDYQREEQENRAKSRQRVERQLKIGKILINLCRLLWLSCYTS